MATAEDSHLPTYDNTKLVAINTCPTWGIMRYAMHKRMPGAGRAMALECGTAMHEVFAWVRLVTLAHQLMNDDTKPLEASVNAWRYHGKRLFGEDRFNLILDQTTGSIAEPVELAKNGSICVLETSGYYDDPKDKRRTLSNMEECSFAYIDRWKWDNHVWMRDPNDPCNDVGIEIPFDIVVDVAANDGNGGLNDRRFRITGKIDGIHWQHDTLVLHDNKTASRLNDAWSMSFALSTQVTHYCVAASVFTERQIRNADILGLAIPLPRSYDYGGIIREPVSRKDYHFTRWISWLLHTVDMCEQYADNPYDAPKYTHSCNRYFRPCSLIPFCDADDEEQRQIVSEMVIDEWSPLHSVVED